MGVDRQHVADQTASPPIRENSVKRAKAIPAVGIYRPPALRRSKEQTGPSGLPSSPVVETKSERARPTRQRRPDIQVYVPRAKRLSLGEQDHASSANQQNNPPLRSKTITSQHNCSADKNQKPKTLPLQQCSQASALSSSQNDISQRFSIRESSLDAKQVAQINNYLYKYSSENDDIEKLGENRPLVSVGTSKRRENGGRRNRIDQEKFCESVGVGRGMSRRGSTSSSCEYLPGRSSCNTPTKLKNIDQFIDESNNYGMNTNNTKNSTSHFEEANYNFPDPCSNIEEQVVQHLPNWSRSRSVEFTENFLEEVGLGRGFTHVNSRSSSSTSTPGQSGRNTPSAFGSEGAQAWDYFSEIKNTTNSSFSTERTYEMEVQNTPDDSENHDTTLMSEPLDSTLHFEESTSLLKDCDNRDQFLDISSTLIETEIINGSDKVTNSAHGDLNTTESETCRPEFETSVCSENILLSDECHISKKDDDEESQVPEVQNRKNRRIIRGNVMSDVLIISDPEPVVSSTSQCDTSEDKTSPPNGVLTKKKKVRHKRDSGSSPKVQSPEKVKSSSASTVTLNPDECTWDMMFDDNGECLDPKLMEELTSAVGSVAIEKPQSDYRSYQSRVELIMSGAADDQFSHVLEIYNFPPEFKTHDLHAVFSPYMKGGFEIKWVDDTHALGVFSSSIVAADVLATDHPFVKTRPLHQATYESRMKARRSAEFLQPFRARPETCAALARRLVTGALGVKLKSTPEERAAEKKILTEAREKKKLAARQRDEAWEGIIGDK